MTKDPRPVGLGKDEFTGRQLGKYEVLCRLSMGGMAEIFLALQRGAAGFRKLVVLKQVLPDVADDPDLVRRFLEEAKLMAAFSHPSIAQVFDLDRSGEEYFLVMEFVAGVSLLDMLAGAERAKERLPVAFSVTVAHAVARALDYAHAFRDQSGARRPVIHRDVAPKNVMISFEGVAKLLDFGIAKSPAIRTQAGHRLGTPGYMSPEQLAGRSLDGTSDVYSLGVVLHECLTGRRFSPGSPRGRETGGLSDENREVPPTLEAVVRRALAPEPRDRFASALELARALEESLGSPLSPPEELARAVERHFPGRRGAVGERVRTLRERVEATGSVPPALPNTTERSARPGPWLAGAGATALAGLAAVALALWPRAPARRADVPTPHAAPPPAPAAPSPPPPAPPPAEAAVPPEEPAPSPKGHPGSARKPSPKPGAETGTLWVKVRPWARVYLDGVLRGETPLDPFPVAAGSHALTLTNDTLRVRRELRVEVRAKEQRELKVSLEE